MHKLIVSLNNIDRILKDYSSLMTDAYRSDMVEAMKMLYGVSRKVEKYKTRLDIALQAPGGDFKAQLEQMAANEKNLNYEEESFPELTQLQEIINRSNVYTEPIEEAGTSRGQKKSNRSRRTRDVEIVEAEECRIDPLTKGPIKNPVRNKRCRHLYCYETILPYIRTITYPRCPIAGCHLPHIRESDLEFTNFDL